MLTFERAQKNDLITDLIFLVSFFCPWFVIYEVMSVVEVQVTVGPLNFSARFRR